MWTGQETNNIIKRQQKSRDAMVGWLLSGRSPSAETVRPTTISPAQALFGDDTQAIPIPFSAAQKLHEAAWFTRAGPLIHNLHLSSTNTSLGFHRPRPVLTLHSVCRSMSQWVARSISIFDGDSGELVWDSGDFIARYIADPENGFSELFNSNGGR